MKNKEMVSKIKQEILTQSFHPFLSSIHQALHPLIAEKKELPGWAKSQAKKIALAVIDYLEKDYIKRNNVISLILVTEISDCPLEEINVFF